MAYCARRFAFACVACFGIISSVLGCTRDSEAPSDKPATTQPEMGASILSPSVPAPDCPTAAVSIPAVAEQAFPFTWPAMPRCGGQYMVIPGTDTATWTPLPSADAGVDASIPSNTTSVPTLDINGSNFNGVITPCATTLTEIARYFDNNPSANPDLMPPILLTDMSNPKLSDVVPAGSGLVGNVWLLRQSLVMGNGAVLQLHGTSVGGDVDTLLLRSDPDKAVADFTPADPDAYATVRAEYGGLDIQSTLITSWSWETPGMAPGPDQVTNDGRAYVEVRSQQGGADGGGPPQESRMEIGDSTLEYLGYHNGASYGVVWRIPTPTDGTLELFSVLHVYGDASNSHFLYNYFGGYTFGAYGMRFYNNEFAYNIGYGLDPHDSSDDLYVENNHFHDNKTHGFICSKRCQNLQVRNNISENNGINGIMLHSTATNWIVENNQVLNNTGGGIVLWDSSNNTIRGNVISNNQNGILLLAGSSNNVVEGNEIYGSSSYGLYAYIEDPSVAGNGHPTQNLIVDNVFSDGGTKAINLVNADQNTFDNNRFTGMTGTTVGIQASQGNIFRGSCVDGGLSIQSTGAGGISSSTIVDETSASVELDSTSVVVAADPAGILFDSNDHRPNTVSLAGSWLSIPGLSSSSIHLNQLPVAVLPSAGTGLVQVTSWSSSAAGITLWPGTTDQTLQVSFSMLQPSATYAILLGGATLASGQVQSNGQAQVDLPIALPANPDAGLDMQLTVK